MKVSTITCSCLVAVIVAVAPSLLPAPVAAKPGHHQAHVHGVAELTLALEGPNLELLLTSPAFSVVGFEHPASSPRQVEAVAQAQAILRDGSALFVFTGSECALAHAEIDMSAVLEGDADDAVSHDDHDEYEAEEHHHDEEVSHSNISAHYEYTCADTSELQTLLVGTEGLPFELQTINVMWVSDRGQGAAVLSADNRLIEFN